MGEDWVGAVRRSTEQISVEQFLFSCGHHEWVAVGERVRPG